MATLFDTGIFSLIGLDSALLVGAQLDWYTGGTTTRTNTYTTSALSIANANPVISDANGRFPAIYLGAGNYKFVLRNSAGTVLVTRDNYPVAAAPPTVAAGLVNFLAGTAPLPVVNGGTGQTTAGDAAADLEVLPLDGSEPMTGNIVRATKGVHLYWETAAMANGNCFLTTAATSDPTSLAGQAWFKY